MKKKISFKKFLPGIAWFFIVLFLMCIPGNDLPKVDDWLHAIYFDKWIHIGVFGALGILFCKPFNNSAVDLHKRLRYFILIAIGVSIYGYTTELIQKYWIPGRSYDLLDWAADSLGAMLGFIFSKKIFRK